MNTPLNRSPLNVKAFARESGFLSGQDALSKYERLSQEARGLSLDQTVNWKVRGELVGPEGVEGEVWIHLNADTTLTQICQRCLRSVDVELLVERSFRFVTSEAIALEQDPEVEEDLLVFSHDFDLLSLIEDELLMSLPLVPRHDTCPVDVKMRVQDPDFEELAKAQRNPFTLLTQLKVDKGD